MSIFNHNSMSIVRFCATVCARQRSGEFSVYGMVSAYKHALGLNRTPNLNDVNTMAFMIEPEKNKGGIRRTPVVIDNVQIPVPQEGVLDSLLSAWYDMSPDELFREFETQHPYRDGNGRVGAILFNMRNATLAWPQNPPNLWP